MTGPAEPDQAGEGYARACGLDAGRRVIDLDDGRRPAFDGLIIATGVQPRRLPAGHHLAGVHVLRGHADVAGLRAAFESGRQVVIVGAGFLGMEVAAAARAMDVDVTVVDPLAQPMIRQVGPEIGAAIARLHQDHGVQLRTGVGVRELTGADGQVTAVALDDGSTLPAGCALVAIGAVPATGWLRTSGIPLGTASNVTSTAGPHPASTRRATSPPGSTPGTSAGCGWSTG